jgi:hypothetical protein
MKRMARRLEKTIGNYSEEMGITAQERGGGVLPRVLGAGLISYSTTYFPT